MTLIDILAPHGFVKRAKGARIPNPKTLDYSTAEVVGECHLYGCSYDPRGHMYQILVVTGENAKGKLQKYACTRRGPGYGIGPLYNFVLA